MDKLHHTWKAGRAFLLFLGLGALFVLGVSGVSSSNSESQRAERPLQTRAVFTLSQASLEASRAAYHPHPIPTISITSVEKGESVTFMTHNYPAGYEFEVRMGPMYTRGINGTVVGTFSSGAGGSMEQTFDIPESLKDADRISIRASTAHANPFYSFNWFYNQGTSGDNGDGATGGGDQPTPVYTGIPTFKICTVDRNNTVTIATNNFPPNQTFTVRMGAFGTAGIGGVVAGSFESGEGGSLNVTMDIPAALQGHHRIAIRAHTHHAYPYFAYNWFYNNDASVC